LPLIAAAMCCALPGTFTGADLGERLCAQRVA
jgi:hypothetical protein